MCYYKYECVVSQTPSVVVLCGAHAAGAAGAEAARLLASHGVRVSVLVAGAGEGGALGGALEALALGGVEATSALRDLPHPDLVLLALHDIEQDEPHDKYTYVSHVGLLQFAILY